MCKNKPDFKLTTKTVNFRGSRLKYSDTNEYLLSLLFKHTSTENIISRKGKLYGAFEVSFSNRQRDLISKLCTYYGKTIISGNKQDIDTLVSCNCMLHKKTKNHALPSNIFIDVLTYSTKVQVDDDDYMVSNDRFIMAQNLNEDDLIEINNLIRDYDFNDVIMSLNRFLHKDCIFVLSNEAKYLAYNNGNSKVWSHMDGVLLLNNNVMDTIKNKNINSKYGSLFISDKAIDRLLTDNVIIDFYVGKRPMYEYNGKVYYEKSKEEVENVNSEVRLWLDINKIVNKRIDTIHMSRLGWVDKKIHQLKKPFIALNKWNGYTSIT